MNELEIRVRAYLVAYDDYQTAVVRARLSSGWAGSLRDMPPGLADRYRKAQTALANLRGVLGMLPINYVTTAQKELEAEADESRRKAQENENDPNRN